MRHGNPIWKSRWQDNGGIILETTIIILFVLPLLTTGLLQLHKTFSEKAEELHQRRNERVLEIRQSEPVGSNHRGID